MPNTTDWNALERRAIDAPPTRPPIAAAPTETPVLKATRRMMDKMETQRAEIARLASAVRAALA